MHFSGPSLSDLKGLHHPFVRACFLFFQVQGEKRSRASRQVSKLPFAIMFLPKTVWETLARPRPTACPAHPPAGQCSSNIWTSHEIIRIYIFII